MISLNVSCGDGRGEEGKRRDGMEGGGKGGDSREWGGVVKIKNFIYL